MTESETPRKDPARTAPVLTFMVRKGMIGVFALAFLNVVYQLMTSDGLPFGAFGLIFAVGLLYIVLGLLWEAKTGRKLPRGTAGMGGMGPTQGLQDTIDSGSSDGSGGSN